MKPASRDGAAALDDTRAFIGRFCTKGTGPRCIKLPNGQLRVRRADLESWLDARGDAA